MDNVSSAYAWFISALVVLFGWMISLFFEPLFCHSSELIETLAYRKNGNVIVVSECSLPERMGVRDHSLEARKLSRETKILIPLNAIGSRFANLEKVRVLIDFDRKENFYLETGILVLGSKYLDHPKDFQRAVLFRVFFPKKTAIDFAEALVVEVALNTVASEFYSSTSSGFSVSSLYENSCAKLPFFEFNSSFCKQMGANLTVSGPWQFFTLFAAKLIEPLESKIQISSKIQFLARLAEWRLALERRSEESEFNEIKNWGQALVKLSQLRSELWNTGSVQAPTQELRVIEVEDLKVAFSMLSATKRSEVRPLLVFPAGEYSESPLNASQTKISKWITLSCSAPTEKRENLPSSKIHEWIWIHVCDLDSEKDLNKLAKGILKSELEIPRNFEFFRFHPQSLISWSSDSRGNFLEKLTLGDRATWLKMGLQSQVPLPISGVYSVESVRRPLLSFRSPKLNQALTELLSEGNTNY